jgi:hypothetical protein
MKRRTIRYQAGLKAAEDEDPILFARIWRNATPAVSLWLACGYKVLRSRPQMDGIETHAPRAAESQGRF